MKVAAVENKCGNCQPPSGRELLRLQFYFITAFKAVFNNGSVRNAGA